MSGRSPRWIPSKLRTRLSDLAIGSTIKLNEDGSPVEFYVAKHDYEPDLNGNGRTLMVRKDCYDTRYFSSSTNVFRNSAIDTWLNNTWLKLLDADVQAVVGTTTFYVIAGDGSSARQTLTKPVFLLSTAELNKGPYNDGTELDQTVYGQLAIAYYNGAAVTQWTRTPRATSSAQLYVLSATGGLERASSGENYGSRPVFTLPSDFLVTNDMLA